MRREANLVKFRTIILASSLVFACPSAWGQTSRSDQAARTLFAEAVEDEGAQRWQQALEKFERVSALKKSPGVLGHIALCKEHLGRFLEAVDDYEKAIALAREQKNKGALQVVDDALAKLRTRIPSLRVVVSAREGLELSVTRVQSDGVEVAVKKEAILQSSDGYQLQVDPGDYAVNVRAPGFQPYRVARRIPEGQITSLVVELEPLRPEPAPVPPASLSVQEAKPREGSWTTKHTVSVGLLGAGVLALAAGGGFALMSNSNKDEADNLGAELPGSSSRSQCSNPATVQVSDTCGRINSARDAQDTQHTLSTVFYVTGGVLIVGAAATWFLWPKSKPKGENAYVTPVFDVAGRSIGLQGAF